MSDILTSDAHRANAESEAPNDALRVWRDENGVWYADVLTDDGIRTEPVYTEPPVPADVDLYDLIGGAA